jgi:Phytanoyl-CoA dioxygenase (PhyH)
VTESNSLLPLETFAYTNQFRGRELPKSLRFAHLVRAVILSPILLLEWKALVGRRKSRMRHAITLLNDISNATHGRGLEVMNRFICRIRNHASADEKQRRDCFATPAGHLMHVQSVNLIVNELRQVGFSRIPTFIDPLVVKKLLTDILKLPGKSTKPTFSYQSQDEWQRDTDSGPRYTVSPESIKGFALCQEVATNEVIREVALQYLGCSPILASTQVWTTRPPNSKSAEVLSEAAMAFHCDSDYFGFLKFFLLLTNVGMRNGPFTFVGGSHRGKRHVSGRMNDSEIVSDEDVVYYGTGQAGDLVIVDSTGWHKASPPQDGYRTMFQIVYSSSLFGFPT